MSVPADLLLSALTQCDCGDGQCCGQPPEPVAGWADDVPLTAEPGMADGAPLTSEPPMTVPTALTSEAPDAGRTALTSEPAAPADPVSPGDCPQP